MFAAGMDMYTVTSHKTRVVVISCLFDLLEKYVPRGHGDVHRDMASSTSIDTNLSVFTSFVKIKITFLYLRLVEIRYLNAHSVFPQTVCCANTHYGRPRESKRMENPAIS